MNLVKDNNTRQNGVLYLSFLNKKTERIMSAIYLITNSFSEKEVLRWKLRKHSADLFDLSMSLNQEFLLDKNQKLSDIQNIISQLVSFLELASDIDLLSVMNLEILKRELSFISDFVENNLSNLDFKEAFSLKAESFKIKDRFLAKKILSEPKQKIKDKILIVKGQIEKNNNDLNKDNLSFMKKNILKNKEDKKINRREVIIQILSKGQKLTIKDISKNIQDCSDKTIQRELTLMLKEGVLKKEGERRWSRYFLIKK